MGILNVEVKEESVAFVGTDTVAISYNFTNTPFVTATSILKNVNVWAFEVTNTGCLIRTSAPITGNVHVHIIGNK
jgi:hypothetical protein